MSMELKLERFIFCAETISDIHEQTEDTPVVIRHTLDSEGVTITLVCSKVEPLHMVLPLNVVWINFDSSSKYYRKALKRVSKDSDYDKALSGYVQSWQEIYFFEDIVESQYFDEQDMALFDVPDVPLATTTTQGLVRLSSEPLTPSSPVAVASGDPRMINNRQPTEHAHEEKPFTKMFSGTNTVEILDQAVPMPGFTIQFDSFNRAVWAQIRETDIEAGGYRE